MPNFNLADYETVEERLAKFHADYPTARVETEMAHYSEDRVVFKATVFKNYEDEKSSATGYAEETRGKGGMVNSTSHLENCETSALGRALANLGYAPKGARPSREEMEKVQRLSSSSGQNGTISSKQLVAVLKMEAYQRGRMTKEEAEELKEEIETSWTVQDVSDYIGKVRNIDQIREGHTS